MSATDTRIYSDTYERVFTEAQNALIDCKFKIEASDVNRGKIMASAGMSLTSWGETLAVTVGTTQYGVQVTMFSKPYILDWGKSKENVRNFFLALERRLAVPTRYPPIAPGTAQAWRTASYVGHAPPEPSPVVPTVLALLNGVVPLLFVPYFIGLDLGIGYAFAGFMLLVAFILFIGSTLIFAKKYKAGAVFCALGGAITIPIGMLGIFAALKAWESSKWISKRKIAMLSVSCYNCKTTFQVETKKRPFKVKCPRCRSEGMVR